MEDVLSGLGAVAAVDGVLPLVVESLGIGSQMGRLVEKAAVQVADLNVGRAFETVTMGVADPLSVAPVLETAPFGGLRRQCRLVADPPSVAPMSETAPVSETARLCCSTVEDSRLVVLGESRLVVGDSSLVLGDSVLVVGDNTVEDRAVVLQYGRRQPFGGPRRQRGCDAAPSSVASTSGPRRRRWSKQRLLSVAPVSEEETGVLPSGHLSCEGRFPLAGGSRYVSIEGARNGEGVTCGADFLLRDS